MPVKKYILAIDQGTTSSRAFLFNRKLEVVAMAQQEFPQYFPEPGFVLHDPLEIFNSVLQVIQTCIQQSSIQIQEIQGIGITNQRETTVVWRRNGKPIYPAIVWQSRQSAEIIERWKRDKGQEYFLEKTGLVPDAYFSSGKLKWIFENVPEASTLAEQGELLFGTIDTWLIWKLSGGKSHITDHGNASRTMLFDIHQMKWDESLCNLAGALPEMLPNLVESIGELALTDADVCGFSLPILAVAGDQQAALFGQTCFNPGEAKVTYGTGCFLLANTGTQALLPENGLLSTVAWTISGRTHYALEGSVFVSGSLIQWFRDALNFIDHSSDSEVLAAGCDDNGGVVIVPAFTGLGAPYWDSEARGSIFGLTRGTSKAHIMRAALESMALQTADILQLMEQQIGHLSGTLKVDGGATHNEVLMQFQADILQRKIDRPAQKESTVAGVASMAAFAANWFKSLEDLSELYVVEKTFSTLKSADWAVDAYQRWQKAVVACRMFR